MELIGKASVITTVGLCIPHRHSQVKATELFEDLYPVVAGLGGTINKTPCHVTQVSCKIFTL